MDRLELIPLLARSKFTFAINKGRAEILVQSFNESTGNPEEKLYLWSLEDIEDTREQVLDCINRKTVQLKIMDNLLDTP